jgi:hypothetical protein
MEFDILLKLSTYCDVGEPPTAYDHPSATQSALIANTQALIS